MSEDFFEKSIISGQIRTRIKKNKKALISLKYVKHVLNEETYTDAVNCINEDIKELLKQLDIHES